MASRECVQCNADEKIGLSLSLHSYCVIDIGSETLSWTGMLTKYISLSFQMQEIAHLTITARRKRRNTSKC
jgi:hypothetical protein